MTDTTEIMRERDAWKARALLAEKHRAENEHGLVEALADTARLDWLESRDGAFDHLRWGDYANYWGPAFPVKLRAAIDAAKGGTSK